MLVNSIPVPGRYDYTVGAVVLEPELPVLFYDRPQL